MIRALAIAAAAVLFMGCGGVNATLRQHAIAASSLNAVNESAVVALEGECERRAGAAAESGATADEGERAALDVLRTCEQLAHTQHAVAEAHDGWTRTLLLMAVKEETFDKEILMHLALELVRLYMELEDAVEAWAPDVDFPDLPEVVRSVVGENPGGEP